MDILSRLDRQLLKTELYKNDRIFARLKAIHERCIEWTSYDNRKYDEEDYNYEKYVKSM